MNSQNGDRKSEYIDSNSDRFNIANLKNSAFSSQILCKITFDLD
jgi:hypothetical protein